MALCRLYLGKLGQVGSRGVGPEYGTPSMRILPRPLGPLLSDALGTLGRTWKVLVPLAIGVFIPASLATLAAYSIPGALEFIDKLLTTPRLLADLTPDEFAAESRPFLVASAITLIVQALATIFVFVASHHTVVADIKGEKPTWRTAVRGGLRSYPSAALAGVLGAAGAIGLFFLGLTFWSVPAVTVGTPNQTAALVAMVLFVAFTGPGIWLAASLSMSTATATIEGRSPFKAMSRSARLVRRRWWATFGFLLMVGFLGTIALQMVQLVAIPVAAAGGGGNAPVASLLGVLAQGPIVTAMGVTFTTWYIDLRARKEPLTLDQL